MCHQLSSNEFDLNKVSSRIMFLKDDPKDFNYITVHILEFAHLNELICHYICYGTLDKCLHSQGPRSLTIM